MKVKRLSADDFYRLAKQTRMRENAVSLAYRVLVDDASIAVVAKEADVSWSRVKSAVQTIERRYFDANTGSGLVEATVAVPMDLSLALTDFAERLAGSDDRDARLNAERSVTESIKAAAATLAPCPAPPAKVWPG